MKFFFAGLGTCGRVSGVKRYLKEQNADIQVTTIEPQQGHRLPGLKNLQESKPPGILDRSMVDQVMRADDEAAYAMTKRLFREEGLIVGPSADAIVHAAVQFGQAKEGVAVAVSPDSGFRYASFFADVRGEEGNPKSWTPGVVEARRPDGTGFDAQQEI